MTGRPRAQEGGPDRLLPAPVTVPAGNAQAPSPAALDSILAQDYGGVIEVIVADGSDTSATRDLLRVRFPGVRRVPNPEGTIPCDLNRALGAGEGPVDTTFPGVFRRDMLDAAGGWDESLPANEDDALNWVLRACGGIVWFDPTLVVDYRPRGDVRTLALQYFGYGRRKAAMLARHRWWRSCSRERQPRFRSSTSRPCRAPRP